MEGAHTATAPYAVSSWADKTASAFTPGETDVALNGSTAVTAVAAPAGSTQRLVRQILVYNADTVQHAITVRLNNNSTIRILGTWSLAPGQTLIWDGGTVSVTGGASFGNGIVLPVGGFIGALTAVVTPATNTTYFQYLGRMSKSLSSLTALFNVTTALITPTWAEVGFATGTPVHNGAATLTRVGYTDVSGTFASTGIKKTTVAVSGVNPGSDLWIAYGDQASTLAILRALLADNLQSGYFQSYAGRLSTMPGSTVCTLVAAATALAWCSAGGL